MTYTHFTTDELVMLESCYLETQWTKGQWHWNSYGSMVPSHSKKLIPPPSRLIVERNFLTGNH